MTTRKFVHPDYVDESRKPLVDPSKATTVEDFLSSIYVFADMIFDPPTSLIVTHTVDCDSVTEVFSYVVGCPFRKRAGYKTLRMTGYCKREAIAGSPTGWFGYMVLSVFNYDSTSHVYTTKEMILTAGMVKYVAEVDVSGLTDDELYVMRPGMSAGFTGGSGTVRTSLVSPVVELLP